MGTWLPDHRSHELPAMSDGLGCLTWELCALDVAGPTLKMWPE